jgi:hypothetical protein
LQQSILINCIYCQNNTIQTGCSTPICVFSNQNLRFGTGSENSINNAGLFVQPWYYSYSGNSWYKLTFSSYPLDTAIGTGFGSSHWSGSTIVDLYTLTPLNIKNDYSNYIISSQDSSKTVGYGKIIATRWFIIGSNNIVFENTFSLGKNDSFVKVNTRIINNSSNTINNILIWVGTRDDFVGLTDVNIKTRGNLINGNFSAITSNNQDSRAIMITNTNEGVLFYSETPGVMTAYSSCCSFANVFNTNPLTILPATPTPTDGSYAAVLPLGNISSMLSGNIIWYYAAGATSSLSSVAQSVAIAQVADVIAPLISLTPSIQPYYQLIESINSSSSPFISPSSFPSIYSSSSPIISPSINTSNSPFISPSSLPSIYSTNSPFASINSSNSPFISPSSLPSINSSNSPFISSSINSSISPSNIPSISSSISPSMIASNSIINTFTTYMTLTNIASINSSISPSSISSNSILKTHTTYMTPSSLLSHSSTVSTTPNSYQTATAVGTSSSTQTTSPIIPDKILNVQLNNDIISNFIVINVASIFIIFALICISLSCVYIIVLYRKKNYCEDCKKDLDKKDLDKKELEKKELEKKELNPANLKLAFVVDSKLETDVNSEDDVIICSENNNTKLPNSIDS